jgi:hypothetical protein
MRAPDGTTTGQEPPDAGWCGVSGLKSTAEAAALAPETNQPYLCDALDLPTGLPATKGSCRGKPDEKSLWPFSKRPRIARRAGRALIAVGLDRVSWPQENLTNIAWGRGLCKCGPAYNRPQATGPKPQGGEAQGTRPGEGTGAPLLPGPALLARRSGPADGDHVRPEACLGADQDANQP